MKLNAEKQSTLLKTAPENIGSSASLWPVPTVYGLIGESPKPMVIAPTLIPAAKIKSPPKARLNTAAMGTIAMLFSYPQPPLKIHRLKS